MCGIVGFTGNNEAAPILLDGLSKLEYRGYDSAGIAVRNGDAEPEIVKAKGKLKVLKEMTKDGKAVKDACGIGHTRWATHGEPSTVNAHPHCSDDENVIAVHNGIIENYQELREKLIKKGYTFKSETIITKSTWVLLLTLLIMPSFVSVALMPSLLCSRTIPEKYMPQEKTAL